MKRITSTIIALAGIATATTAQNNMSKEITVDRTIVPVERSATRLSSATPELLPYNARMVTLTPAEYNRSSPLTTSLTFLEPASWRDTIAVAPWRGYAGIGYFPLYNVWANVGLRVIDTKRTSLQGWVQYDGADYKAELSPGYKPSFAWHQVNAGASFAQRVGDVSRFTIDASAMYDTRRLPFSRVIAKTQSGSALGGDIDLAWKSLAGAIDYRVSVGAGVFGFFSDMNFFMPVKDNLNGTIVSVEKDFASTPARELTARFAAEATYHLNDNMLVGLDLTGEYVLNNNILYRTPVTSTTHKTVMFNNYGVTGIAPHYDFRAGRFSGEAGVKMNIMAEDGCAVKVAPDVHLHYVPSSVLGLDLDIDGGMEVMNLRRVFDISPYMFRSQHYNPENTPLNMHLSVNIGPFAQGVSASVYGDYNVVRGYLSPGVLFTSNAQVNSFSAGDLTGWHAGVRVNYTHAKLGSIYIKGETASQGHNRGYAPWRDHAGYVVGAGVQTSVIENLDLGIDYELRALRRCYSYNPGSFVLGTDMVFVDDASLYTPVNLHNISNLSLSAAYHLNKRLTVFLRGENLLNRSSNDVFDLPMQGIHGLAGVTFKL